jgi:hypothetical protein
VFHENLVQEVGFISGVGKSIGVKSLAKASQPEEMQ